MPTWIKDDNGNRCSVERWGTEERAREALESLIACSDCCDCCNCFRCSGCTDCFHCSGCSGLDLNKSSPEQSTIIVPTIRDIHRAVYAAVSKPNALKMDLWHTCEKTHCRAGWVVTLAGEAGKNLEKRFDTLLAAMKIYDVSDPGFKINPCLFFDSNEDALADMKRLAEGEAQHE